MKLAFLGALAVVAVAGAADAQLRPLQPLQPLRPVQPYGYQAPQPPSSGSSYDYRSGNSYYWRRGSDGSTTVNGYNTQDGSMWNNRIQPNGNQSGTDSRGNYWTYDARTGSYINSNGTICVGQGAARICN